jgi:mRNA-degrading endonuclease RelE of RelBE toxin-antitoxin system
MPSHQIFLTPQAQLMLHSISDRQIRNVIARRIEGLTKKPTKKGKAVVAELTGFCSLRVARYCVLYKVEKEKVIIVAAGIRKEGDTKDIHARAKKLLRPKSIDLPIDRKEEA